MVEEDDSPRIDGTLERDCVRDTRVTPADSLFVLFVGVLRVVQEQVDALGDRGA